MGRKRLPEKDKRQTLHITLPKHLIDVLKEKNINISRAMEESIKWYLQIEDLIKEVLEKEENKDLSKLAEQLLKEYLKKE